MKSYPYLAYYHNLIKAGDTGEKYLKKTQEHVLEPGRPSQGG